MHPILIRYPIIIRSWSLIFTLAVILSVILCVSKGKKKGESSQFLWSFCLWLIIIGIVGARILHVVLYPSFYHSLKDVIWDGGLILHGGLGLSFIVGLIWLKLSKRSFWKITNLLSPYIALGFSIGRVGCFLNGCCYGIPCKFGVIFPKNSLAGSIFPNQPLFPTQLISSINLFLIFLLLTKYEMKFSPFSLLWFFLFYSIHRFLIEFPRADYPKIIFYLTLPQIISIIVIVSSGFLLYYYKKSEKGGRE